MKIIEYQEDNYTIKKVVITHRFRGYPDLIVSGKILYMLPRTRSKRYYPLKELKKKYHLGSEVYLVDTKRVTTTKLKSLAIPSKEEVFLEKVCTSPF